MEDNCITLKDVYSYYALLNTQVALESRLLKGNVTQSVRKQPTGEG